MYTCGWVVAVFCFYPTSSHYLCNMVLKVGCALQTPGVGTEGGNIQHIAPRATSVFSSYMSRSQPFLLNLLDWV